MQKGWQDIVEGIGSGGDRENEAFCAGRSPDSRDPAKLASGRAGSQVTADGEPVVVLLIEDDRNVRETTRIILEDSGYKVVMAENASDGLETFDRLQQKIGLVVSDVVMPGMGVREFCQKLRAIRPEVKILLVSGYGENIIAERGLGDTAGIRFLCKPYTIDQILGVIDGWLAEP